VGPIFDTVSVSRAVEGTMCEELVRHVNVYNALAHFARVCCLASSVVSPRGYENKR
jgi:hypothetical protein